MNTSCKNCIFAQYEDKTQTSCYLGMIDRARSANVEIIEAYDEEKEFYVLKDALCPFSKTEEWKKAKKLDKSSLDKLADIIKNESVVTCDLYIYISNESRLADLSNTLLSIKKMSILPKSLIFIVNSKRIGLSSVNLKLRQVQDLPNYKIQLITEDKATKSRSIDIVVNSCKSMYYAYYDSGNRVDSDLIKNLNDRIQNFEKVMYVNGDKNGDGTIILTKLHKAVCGENVIEKYLEIKKQQDAELKESQESQESKECILSQ